MCIKKLFSSNLSEEEKTKLLITRKLSKAFLMDVFIYAGTTSESTKSYESSTFQKLASLSHISTANKTQSLPLSIQPVQPNQTTNATPVQNGLTRIPPAPPLRNEEIPRRRIPQLPRSLYRDAPSLPLLGRIQRSRSPSISGEMPRRFCPLGTRRDL